MDATIDGRTSGCKALPGGILARMLFAKQEGVMEQSLKDALELRGADACRD